MPKKYFSNHEVFWQAAKNVQWITNKSLSCYNDNPRTTVEYDRRNLSDLAGLIIDLSGVPENQKDAYFEAEMKKIFEAFDTPSKDDPEKSDPELIKPYIQQMFNRVETDLNSINYNDVNQVTRLLLTMRSTQMLATMVANYPEECSNLFATNKEKQKLDSISAKVHMTYMEGRVRMSEEGLDEISQYVDLGHGIVKDSDMLFTAEINNVLSKAKLENSDSIVFDPESSDMMSHYFLGESFVNHDVSGIEPLITETEYTDQDCLKRFPEVFAENYTNTTFEHLVISRLMNDHDDKDKLEPSELLLIEGKSMKDIIAEQKALLNGDERRARLEAGKIFRNALLDGTSKVTLLSTTLEANGEMTVTQRDIKVNLDKLNEMARVKEHNWFRRVLHALGWRIPPKYPDNKSRDEILAAKSERPGSNHNKGVEAMKARIVEKFNGLKRPFTDKRNIVDLVPKATLVEEPLTKSKQSSLGDLYPVPEGISVTNEFVANGPEEVMSFRRDPVSIPKEHIDGKAPLNNDPENAIDEKQRTESKESSLGDLYPIPEGISTENEFVANGPTEVMSFRQEQSNKKPENKIAEEPPKQEAPKQEAPKQELPKQEPPQPKVEKSPNQLKAEQLAADSKVKEKLAAEILKLTERSNLHGYLDVEKSTANLMKKIQSGLTCNTAIEAALKMWEALNNNNPLVVEKEMAQHANDCFSIIKMSLGTFKLEKADELAAAQIITDMVINRFSPVAFDKKYAQYGDSYYLKHVGGAIRLQEIENIDDFGTARRAMFDALETIKNYKEPVDLSDAFLTNDKDEKKSPKIEETSARSRVNSKE